MSFPGRCVVAVLSGAAYAAAFPPVGWGVLVVPALAGLLVILRDQSGTRARALGFLFGITAFGLSLSWLLNIFGPAAIVLWIVLAAFPALFAHMQGLAGRLGISGWRWVGFTAVNWCGWEFIRAEIFPLKFPWMTAGLAMGPNSLLPWIGVYGVSLWVILIAVLIVSGRWKPALVPTAVLLMCVLHFRLSTVPAPTGDSAVKIAGVQYEDVTLETFLDATRKLPDDVRHVVWPEYALPYDFLANDGARKDVEDLCKERGITLTFGTKHHPREEERWRNIAMTVDASGVRGQHNKIHTVHLFDDGIAGKTALAVDTDHGKIGTPICFDCDYEGVIRKMTAAGAEMILSPVMDARIWSARQHDQHAELFRIRACENGRWIFSAATSGVSQAIDPRGKVHARLGAMEEGSLVSEIGRESRLTFYTRSGWLTPWVVLTVALVGWVFLIWKSASLRFGKL